MASAGPNAPGTMANDTAVGINAWGSLDNAKISDNIYALSPNTGYTTGYSNYLKATNFGFAIPSGATIDGITVSIERKSSYNSTFYTTDHVVSLVKGGAVSGNNKADIATKWPTSDGIVSYGGAADLWGVALTDSDVNASTFGVVLEARLVRPSKGSVTAFVDFISITVTYTEGGGGASAVPTIMNQYRQRRA